MTVLSSLFLPYRSSLRPLKNRKKRFSKGRMHQSATSVRIHPPIMAFPNPKIRIKTSDHLQIWILSYNYYNDRLRVKSLPSPSLLSGLLSSRFPASPVPSSFPLPLRSSPLPAQSSVTRAKNSSHWLTDFLLLPRDSASFPGAMCPHVTGILDVHVVGAEGLPHRCPYGTQDVYARVMCSNGGAALHTRTAKQGGTCPVFNQRLQVGIPEGETAVRLELWMASHNRGTADDQLLGSARIPIAGMLLERSKSVPMEFSLTNNEEGCEINAGVIRMNLTYHARLQSSGGSIISQMSRGGASSLAKTLAGILSNSRIAQNNNKNNNNNNNNDTDNNNNINNNYINHKSTSNTNNSNGAGSKRCSPEASFESPTYNFSDYSTDSEVQSPRIGKRNRTLLWDLDNSLPESQSDRDNSVTPLSSFGQKESLLKLGSLCLPDIDVELENENSFKQGFFLPPTDEPRSCSFSANNPSPNSPYPVVPAFVTSSSLEQQKSPEPVLTLWEAPAPMAPISPSPEWGMLETTNEGEGAREGQEEDEVNIEGEEVEVAIRELRPPIVKHDFQNVSLREGLAGEGEEETLETIVMRSGQNSREYQSGPVAGSHGGGEGELAQVRINSSAGIDWRECNGNMFFTAETGSRPELLGIQKLHFGLLVDSVTGKEKKTGESHGWIGSEWQENFTLASNGCCADKSMPSGNGVFGPIRSLEGMLQTRESETLENCSPKAQILDPHGAKPLTSLRSYHATSLSNTVEQPSPHEKEFEFVCHQKSVSENQRQQQHRLGVEEIQRNVFLQQSSLQEQYLDFVGNQRKVAETAILDSEPAFGAPSSVLKGGVFLSVGQQEQEQIIQRTQKKTKQPLSLLEQYCLRQRQQLELQNQIGIQLSQQVETEAVRSRQESTHAERVQGGREGMRVHRSMREDWLGKGSWPEEEPEKGEFETCGQYNRFLSDLILSKRVWNQPGSTSRVETGLPDVVDPLFSNLVEEGNNVARRETEEDTINLAIPKNVHF